MEASGTRHASETTPTSFFKTGKDWISRAPAAAECHASPPLKGKQCCSRRTVGGYPSTTHAYRGAGGVARLWWCWRGWVRLPLPIKCRRDDANVGARCSVCGQLNREKLNFPCPRSRPRVWSCETGSAVPSRVSPLILFPPAFRHGVVSTPEKRHRVSLSQKLGPDVKCAISFNQQINKTTQYQKSVKIWIAGKIVFDF